MRAIEWCPRVLAQVAVFVLKPMDVSGGFSGTFIRNQFAGRGRRNVIEYFSIRLICNVSIKCVTIRSRRARIGFTVGILALARVWVVRYA